MAKHKGSAIAAMVDTLSGDLTSSGFLSRDCCDIVHRTHAAKKIPGEREGET
jgi:LDH2 family malate/lactate/ureidoglycolate dehydrogenase